MAVVSNTATIHLLDTGTLAKIQSIKTTHDFGSTGLCFSPDDQLLLSASADRKVFFFPVTPVKASSGGGRCRMDAATASRFFYSLFTCLLCFYAVTGFFHNFFLTLLNILVALLLVASASYYSHISGDLTKTLL